MGAFGGLPSAVAGPVERETLSGQLRWAGTNGPGIEHEDAAQPVVGAQVRVAGTNLRTETDLRGHWSFELPHGDYTVHFSVRNGEAHRRARLVRQTVPQYKPAIAYLVPSDLRDAHPPQLMETRESDARRSTPSTASSTAPLHVVLPSDLEAWPDRIRVGRRADPGQGCRDNPVVAIEEMPLSTYVRGVLPPEIGVFRDLPRASEIFKAFAVAAASYGMWFRLHYAGADRRTVPAPLPPDGLTWFHIDDTACNQRYSDTRIGIADRAVDAVEGELLTHASNARRLDKYEYAASCGGFGTRPEYQTDIIADHHFDDVCVGGWCGHTECAGHEDHPGQPGPDRCLVRGICQWGAAGMAAQGHDYRDILGHYQPNLMLQRREPVPERTVELTGFVYTDPADIPGTAVADVQVRLGDLRSARTGTDGRFRFREIPWKGRPTELSAEHPNYTRSTMHVQWSDTPVTWVSLQMDRRRPEPLPDASLQDVGQTPEVRVHEPACSSIGPGVGAMMFVGLAGFLGCRRRIQRSA
jgi:hypothetical protein